MKRLRSLAAVALLLLLPGPAASGLEIKQGATATKVNFLLVSSTDHVTPVTGLSPTVTISKNGAAFASPGGSVAEVGNGWYALTPSAGDSGTLGDLIVHATGTGADPADRLAEVVAYDPTAATGLGLSNLDAAVSTRSTYAGADTSGTTTLLSRVPGTVQPQTGDAFARVGAAGAGLTAVGDTAGTTTLLTRLGGNLTVSGGKVAATVAAGDGADAASVKATLGVAGAGLTALGDTRLANLDAAVSTRLASSGYAAPDNTTLGYLLGLLNGGHTAFTSTALASAPTGGASYIPVGAVVLGSTTSSVVVSGLPSGRVFTGQHLWHQSGESRLIGSQSFGGGNYTFGIVATPVLPGSFTSLTAGDTVRPTP